VGAVDAVLWIDEGVEGLEAIDEGIYCVCNVE
jgi:hypothetical protein